MRLKFKEAQMSTDNMSGTVLIRENTPLPIDLAVKTDLVFPGWTVVRNLDVYELGRKIQKANWNLFYLAGEIQAIALGRKGSKTGRRAVGRILSKLKRKQFNCLEITEIIEKRFLGLSFVTVTAHSRHIQESLYLVPVAGRIPGVTAAAPKNTSDSGERLLHGQVFATQDAALL
jgi:hypothetical protein